jgi:hypothetical protein
MCVCTTARRAPSALPHGTSVAGYGFLHLFVACAVVHPERPLLIATADGDFELEMRVTGVWTDTGDAVVTDGDLAYVPSPHECAQAEACGADVGAMLAEALLPASEWHAGHTLTALQAMAAERTPSVHDVPHV